MRSKLLLSAIAALAATTASAADLASGKKAPPAPVYVSPWDFTVGAGLTSNYLFRGISQSDNKPSVNANAEIRYTFNDMLTAYVGTAGSSVKLTNQDASPSLEWDVMGGLRGTFGSFGVDVGAVGYIYPSFRTDGNVIFPTNPTWWEGYVKTSYAVNDSITLGVNAFFTPSYLDTSANGTYLAGTAAVKLPYDFAISGEIGYQWLGTTDAQHAPYSARRNLPDYTYWNVGASYTYKIATLDLRYHDTSLSKSKCSDITGPTNGVFTPTGVSSKYCNAAFVATLSFSLQGKDLK